RGREGEVGAGRATEREGGRQGRPPTGSFPRQRGHRRAEGAGEGEGRSDRRRAPAGAEGEGLQIQAEEGLPQARRPPFGADQARGDRAETAGEETGGEKTG